ncbi:nitrate reductase subunit beta [Hydrogenibacillus schlegelii]|uniref:Nitrate reductase n=1 Tax=Hydrogenibacillus schlegelii TaxID=1484 RepID=A0A132N9F7_HYDSH|nr:nitrate reductase subunit beta [Hydrogenibacillus schlegelii]KWX06597.1 nitrate reductase [Hydrogenibacillus schlegelii]OAR04340.1 nitrate reductase [Hydrogenibacillus schlegelii]
MRIKAHVAMVMNLDKCIGCHTCSITCKNTWTNRPGAEYMWWNNVETKPGVGYPREWENQEKYKGGWELKNGELELRSGSRARRLAHIFHNPDLPTLDDYYEPWTYDYEMLTTSPERKRQPVARPKSIFTGSYMNPEWGPNWEDDLAGAPETGPRDPLLKGLEERVQMAFEQVFMFHLPRICEHCLNPPCVSSCPSGAMYKRDEDGIVLVDQEACRGWRFCVSSCPYKKVYFNWHTGKAEKCTLCFPRLEAGLPTICSETCVGRIRYLGLLLYDADAVKRAASAVREQDLYAAQLGVFLDPHDPEVIAQARREGIPDDWIAAAQRSPVYKLIVAWKVALPLHPEYRTLPMVWYIPPLSPLVHAVEGDEAVEGADVFLAIDLMRIPIAYLANLLAAGDVGVVRGVLKKLAVLRAAMRARTLGKEPDGDLLRETGLDEATVNDMYRLLAIAKYHDRFVLPTAHREQVADLFGEQGTCGLSFAGTPGGCGL